MISRPPQLDRGRTDLVRCSVAHAAVVAALHAQCFDEAWNADALARMLSNPDTFGLIAQRQDEPLGFILCRVAGGEGEVLTLGVIPSARRRAAAEHLLDAALEEAASRGALALFLEVAADNTAARSLYRSHGFREVGRRRQYYESGDDGAAADALILRRDLSRA